MVNVREISLTTPLRESDVRDLNIRDLVYLTGVIYTARDLAHRRVLEYVNARRKLPLNLEGAAIFHAGPIVEKEKGEWKLAVVGPTTSIRMEPYEHEIISLGARAIIGKGGMGEKTEKALMKHGAVFLVAAPGCAVVHACAVERIIDVQWYDLGMMEAMWILEVKRWGPLTVAMDSKGNNLFREIEDEGKRRLSQIFDSLRL